MVLLRSGRYRWFVLGALLLCSKVAPAQSVRFVKADADGGETGLSWQDAWSDLQTALANIQGDTQIWVAAGTYKPGDARSETFSLSDGVELYGGFAGDEDPASFDLNDRDFSLNETILDGQIGGPGDTDNIYHVVSAIDVSQSAVLDGFTITNGYANGLSTTSQDVGGGMLLIRAHPTIRHCTFISNQAAHGGAIYNDASRPTFEACRFLGNRAIACQVNGPGALGGGLYSVNGSSPTLINTLLSGNRAGCNLGGFGGALYGGGRLINCTLSLNVADTSGGGLAGGGHQVFNSILFGNSTGRGSLQDSQVTGAASVTYSAVEGGYAGIGNIEEDPLFMDAIGADGIAGAVDDNVRLSTNSPCIDAANNEALDVAQVLDLEGRTRIIDDPATVDTGHPIGATAIVDMGALEFQEPCTSDLDCDDQNLCRTDRCDQTTGFCVHETVVCDDGNVCTDDSCDPDLGCVFENNSVGCDNRDACTTGDHCAGGVCVAGPLRSCDDANPCTDDTCDPDTGCINVNNNEPCDDTDACTANDTCLGGTCTGNDLTDCDDDNACTDDSCDPDSGCVNQDRSADCDDGLWCNGAETCDPLLGCLPGTSPHCDDDVSCTTDSCDETLDQCIHDPDDDACDDGLHCNGAETCDPIAGCINGNPPDCDDGIPCTLDGCDETTDACTNQPDHTQCDNGVFCDGAEICDQVANCLLGTPPCSGLFCDEQADACVGCLEDPDCDDAISCTVDQCNPVSNVCEHSLDHAACDDGVFCNGPEICDAATGCGLGTDPCPGLFCDESDDQCVACFTSSDCDDGDVCTTDTCESGSCQATPIPGCPNNPGGGITTDLCPADPAKTDPGLCGCGIADDDSDGDGQPDCLDNCAADPLKSEPGECGCGVPDADSDGDGILDCVDRCPDDPSKTDPGPCGCGVDDIDTDDDETPDCLDDCPEDNSRTTAGVCGCGISDVDTDQDGIEDCRDECSDTPLGEIVSANGCPQDPPPGQTIPDSDGDGISDDLDQCPDTPPGTAIDASGCDEAPIVLTPSDMSPSGGCGTCGTLGFVFWITMFAGLLGARRPNVKKSKSQNRTSAPS